MKRWFERIVAATGLVATSPLLLLLIFLVRITSRGPALYWQERVGLGGRVFRICKLRSMTLDAEEWTGAVWAQEDDPRVTKIGRQLRKFHLDELVQLWNIVRGDMTFVGPRPERPEIAHDLSEEIPGYAHRMMVLPGVTGLAQINLMPDQTLDCVRKKIELDLEYIFTAEPLMELRIVACTILKMLGFPREATTKLLRLARDPKPIQLRSQSVVQKKPESSVCAADRDSFDLPRSDYEEVMSGSPALCGRH